MDTFDSYVLFLLIALPLVGAGLLMLMPGYRPQAIRWTASAFATAALLLSFYAFFFYDHDAGGLQFTRTWNWLAIPGPWPLGDQGITFTLGIDGIAAPMILLTGIVTFAGVLVSWTIADRNKDFFILYFLLLSGVFGVFASLDMFFFFFFYELAVLPMYLLIGVWGSSTTFRTFVRTKEYGALKLTLYLVAGSVLVWIAIMAIFVEAGLGTFNILAMRDATFSPTFQKVFSAFLLVGFGVLAGLWPFHTWSPDGHVAAPTAVSMVHAGVLMKLGAFGIIRIAMFVLPEGTEFWMPALVGLGAVNVIYGAVSAMGQRDLKYVVGYSSISHMGYVLMGLATLHSLGLSGAVLQMFSHGIMTALFFAVVGFIYDRTHTRDIMVLEGLAKRMGVTATFFAVAGLTSLGLPGLSGFVAELLVFLGLFQTYPALGVLGIIGAAITAVYILRLLAKVFFGPLAEQWRAQSSSEPFDKLRTGPGEPSDASRVEGFSTALLVAFLLLVGLFPFPFMRIIDSGVGELLTRFPGAG